MSIQSMVFVLEDSEATGSERLVLLALANHVNGGRGDDWTVWPSVATIASEARISKRTAQATLRRLEKDGRIREAGKGPKGTIKYAIVRDCPLDQSGGAESAPPQITTPGGEAGGSEGVSQAAPEPEGGTGRGTGTPQRRSAVADEEQQVWNEWDRVALKPFGRTGTLTDPRLASIRKALKASEGGVTMVLAAIRAKVHYWSGAAPERLMPNAKSRLEISEVLAPSMKQAGTNATDYIAKSAAEDPGVDWSPARPAAALSEEEKAAAWRDHHLPHVHRYRSELLHIWGAERAALSAGLEKMRVGAQPDITPEEHVVLRKYEREMDNLAAAAKLYADTLRQLGWTVTPHNDGTIEFEAPTA